MIAMRFHSNLFQGMGDTGQFLGIDYTPSTEHAQQIQKSNLSPESCTDMDLTPNLDCISKRKPGIGVVGS